MYIQTNSFLFNFLTSHTLFVFLTENIIHFVHFFKKIHFIVK